MDPFKVWETDSQGGFFGGAFEKRTRDQGHFAPRVGGAKLASSGGCGAGFGCPGTEVRING